VLKKLSDSPAAKLIKGPRTGRNLTEAAHGDSHLQLAHFPPLLALEIRSRLSNSAKLAQELSKAALMMSGVPGGLLETPTSLTSMERRLKESYATLERQDKGREKREAELFEEINSLKEREMRREMDQVKSARKEILNLREERGQHGTEQAAKLKVRYHEAVEESIEVRYHEAVEESRSLKEEMERIKSQNTYMEKNTETLEDEIRRKNLEVDAGKVECARLRSQNKQLSEERSPPRGEFVTTLSQPCTPELQLVLAQATSSVSSPQGLEIVLIEHHELAIRENEDLKKTMEVKQNLWEHKELDLLSDIKEEQVAYAELEGKMVDTEKELKGAQEKAIVAEESCTEIMVELETTEKLLEEVKQSHEITLSDYKEREGKLVEQIERHKIVDQKLEGLVQEVKSKEFEAMTVEQELKKALNDLDTLASRVESLESELSITQASLKQEKEIRVHSQIELEQLRKRFQEAISEKEVDTDSLCKAINSLEQRLEEARSKHSRTLQEHAESEADLLEGLKKEAQRRKVAQAQVVEIQEGLRVTTEEKEERETDMVSALAASKKETHKRRTGVSSLNKGRARQAFTPFQWWMKTGNSMVDASGLTGAGPDAHDVGPHICTAGDREGGDENKSQCVHVARLGVQHGCSHCFTAVQADPEGESLGKFLQTGFDFGFIQSQLAGMDEATIHPAVPLEVHAVQDVAARVVEDGSVFATVERTSLI
jgi:hypothetical protein